MSTVAIQIKSMIKTMIDETEIVSKHGHIDVYINANKGIIIAI